ncbi:MAG: FAD-dependent thymidylate synthase [Chloroflexi bacterium]|nr:FAD-dependent thymidylate synthase [Chloroflexota bacterium]
MPAPKREIYLLSPKQFSPETIAVAFAKTSRAPESFREIVAELSDEQSAQFHEKWVVGYGHASVAEHAVLHLAIENASRLAMEAIESNRLASYTEKSTRYQKWDADNFYIPAELDGHALRDEYIATCRMLFETYVAAQEPVRELVKQSAPRRENETDEAWDRRIRSQYVDVCRFLLPAAALANVGVTANGRVLESAIRKWNSSPLAEVREIGVSVKAAAKSEIPTLVKYAEPVEYLIETSNDLTSLVAEFNQKSKIKNQKSDDWCVLVDYDRDGEARVLASALYRFGEMSYSEALGLVKSVPDVAILADALLKRLGRYDIPLRELEHSSYTFDLLMDQGAYAEFKRHRMMSQTPQLLTGALGYAVPRRFVEAGFESEYRRAMDAAGALWQKLAAWNVDVAQYVVPNGYNRRVLATFNLREAYAFCQLRAAANAHFSMRRVAQRVAGEIGAVHPLLTKYLKLHAETWQGLENEYFSALE